MRSEFQRYVQTWLSVTFLALGSVATFNILVDPIGAFRWGHMGWFEPYRYIDLDRGSRAEMASRGNWEVIILGSSRAKRGLPATYPFFLEHPTCNLSLDGAQLPEMEAVLGYTAQRNPLKHVFLCLDFYMFNRGRDYILNFDETRFGSNLDPFRYYCDGLLGLPASRTSKQLLFRKLTGKPVDPQYRFGFSNHQLGDDTVQRELFDRNLRHLAPGYLAHETDASRYDAFRRIVRSCRDHQIQLHIAIMPVHALDLEVKHAGGLWTEFESWMRKLVEVLAEEGVEQEVELWDFTGYRGPSIERVPPLDTPGARMEYWLESSHCSDKVGRLMLDAMIEGRPTVDFGVQITSENVGEHLARIREDRARYVETHPDEVAWINRIVEATRQQRP